MTNPSFHDIIINYSDFPNSLLGVCLMDMITIILKQHGLKHTVFPDDTIIVEINTRIFFMKKTYYATLRSFSDLLNLFGMAI